MVQLVSDMTSCSFSWWYVRWRSSVVSEGRILGRSCPGWRHAEGPSLRPSNQTGVKLGKANPRAAAETRARSSALMRAEVGEQRGALHPQPTDPSGTDSYRCVFRRLCVEMLWCHRLLLPKLFTAFLKDWSFLCSWAGQERKWFIKKQILRSDSGCRVGMGTENRFFHRTGS